MAGKKKKSPHKKVQFFINIVAGLAVVLSMHLAENTQWGEGILDNAFDGFIKKDAAKAVKKAADTGPLFLVDLARPGPGTPAGKDRSISPRDTIAKVIQMAVDGKAKIIVLDVLLEEKDCCFPGKDQQLREVLEAFPTDKAFKTKIIFAVNIEKNGNPGSNLFDSIIDTNPNFYRAVPTVYATQYDRRVRYWTVCHRYGKDKIIWSIPVLTFFLHQGRWADLETFGRRAVREQKGGKSLEIRFGKKKSKKFVLPFSDDDLYRQRLRFSLIPGDCLDDTPGGNLIPPTLEYLEPQRFRDRILLLGSSAYRQGDIHPTPVGSMAGMYIHGNAVDTLLKGRQTTPAPWYLAILIDVLVIIAASYLLLRKTRSPGSLLLPLFVPFVLSLVLVFGCYWIFFRSFGIFFNFAFGILAVGWFDTFAQLRETYLKIKEDMKKNKEKEVTVCECEGDTG